MKNATTPEQIPVILKKSTAYEIMLTHSITGLDNYKFKIVHSVSAPLTFRFTFYDEADNKSIYIALDIKSGDTFDFYSVSTDSQKKFSRLEIYCDVSVHLGLTIELKTEKLQTAVEKVFPTSK